MRQETKGGQSFRIRAFVWHNERCTYDSKAFFDVPLASTQVCAMCRNGDEWRWSVRSDTNVERATDCLGEDAFRISIKLISNKQTLSARTVR
jgi:hypothetical protein